MSAVEITLPKWGMTMQEAVVSEWLVAVGDTVTDVPVTGPIPQGRIPTSILDLLPVVRHTGPVFRYLRQTSRSLNAAVVAPGAAKPESDIAVTSIDGQLQIIAHTAGGINVYYVLDAPALGQWLSDEMLYGLGLAVEDGADAIIDIATLTGACMSALGLEIAGVMGNDDGWVAQVQGAAERADEPVWRLPLPESYREWLKSDIADLNNSPANGFAGASVAGLFLDRFVAEGIDWAHFDTFAWRPAAKPGRPKGGAALGLRAAWHMLQARYG